MSTVETYQEITQELADHLEYHLRGKNPNFDLIGRVSSETISALEDVLKIDRAKIIHNKKIVGDLGGDSLDRLDLEFRLEQSLGIKIERKSLYDDKTDVFGVALKVYNLVQEQGRNRNS